ncbi:MAG: gluconokinase [Bifidobacteriaceae bacterium]|jgi:carbohydrate kinase (thermoresistant glucokinase family)|nr:gluconokinase [Bifidobacteriaceae bacterium]
MEHATGGQVRVIVVMGVAGSGKTTVGLALAGRLGWDFAEADDFHPSANIAKMSRGVPLADKDRWPWLQVLRAWIDQHLPDGARGVMTCSALKRSYREVLRAPGVVFVHLDGSPALLEGRLAARAGHFMKPAMLASQLADLEPLEDDEDGLHVDLDLVETPGGQVDAILAALALP